jgi:hypothetical protein
MFETRRRFQSKNSFSRLGKMARIWNAETRSGNFCPLCSVDVGGKDEAMRNEQMTNHLKKAHVEFYENWLLSQNRAAEKAAAAIVD